MGFLFCMLALYRVGEFSGPSGYRIFDFFDVSFVVVLSLATFTEWKSKP